MAKTIAMVALLAVTVVEHDGVTYQPGDPLEVTEDQAGPLLAVGAATVVETPAEDATTTTAKPKK